MHPDSRDRRRTALLLSLLACPGAGQLLLGRRRLGLLFALPSVMLGCGLLMAFVLDLTRAVLEAADVVGPWALLGLVLRGRVPLYGGGLLALALLGLASAAEIALFGRRERP